MIIRVSKLRKSGMGVFALLAFLFASAASAQVWRSAGLTGGDVRALASDPRDPRRVYLGTTDGHIFGSVDGGESWKLLGLTGASSNAVVTALIVDPRNSSVIYAATWTRETAGESGGVFISGDAGITWRESGLRAHPVRALTQAASDPDVIVAGALDGVFLSRDGAANWERVSPANDEELRNFDSLAIDPVNPDIIYAGTFHLPWKTVDGGKHWSPIHGGMIDDSDVLSLAVDVTNSQRIFASACSGIYRSDWAGASWEKIAGIPYSSRRTLVIRQDPEEPALLYAGTTEGLWKSSDAGVSWNRISSRDWVINAVVLEPSRGSFDLQSDSKRPSRLLIGTEQQGIVISEDGGANFHAGNEGFYHRRILSVAVDAGDERRVAAVLANAPESVVVSENGGTTWTAMNNGLGSGSVRSIFSLSNGWWAARPSGGLVHFDDAQRAWLRAGAFRETPFGPTTVADADSKARIVQPVVNDLYATETGWFAATEEGLFSSRDQGKTWTALHFGPAALPVQSVRVSKDNKMLRIVSSHGMVFSDDKGRSWTWHDLPLESGGALRLEWVGGSTLLAAARTGLYISRDAGATWSKASAGLPGGPVEGLLVRPGLWVASMLISTQPAGASSGLYASRNDGRSWVRLKSADANLSHEGEKSEFPVLAAAEVPERIFAGSASEGLYLLDFDRVQNAGARQVIEPKIVGGGGH
jgi:photosystem II stability/assembly factor-like uncharacterized protein